ncbi:MAG: hypothetical protein FWH31_00605 [Streptococcaceae bacterium]|nr:hypothetical protein [Streptococcaceae bacterium]
MTIIEATPNGNQTKSVATKLRRPFAERHAHRSEHQQRSPQRAEIARTCFDKRGSFRRTAHEVRARALF